MPSLAGIETFLEGLTLLRMVLGAALMLFLPGLAWSFVFFRRGQIDVVERIALSFGLSIAISTLSLLIMVILFGMKLTGLNVGLVVTVLTIIPVAILSLNRLVRRA